MIRDKPKEKEGDHMPRGQHPNSKKALAEARKKTQFNHERAVEAAKASVKARAQAGAIREDLMRQSTPENRENRGEKPERTQSNDQKRRIDESV